MRVGEADLGDGRASGGEGLLTKMDLHPKISIQNQRLSVLKMFRNFIMILTLTKFLTNRGVGA